jgi:hypothetical protein
MISPEKVLSIVESQKGYLAHNFQLIDIWEGNLSRYVDEELYKQFSLQSYIQAKHRMAPINILPKIIDKLSHIYQTNITREVVGGTETDKELLAWYIDHLGFNEIMNNANELFNLTKTTLLYPFVHKGKPRLRPVLNDRFVVYSNDPVDPSKPTHVVLLAGELDGKSIYWVWSDMEFQIIDSDERIRRDLMSEMQNPEGINPIGRLPFIYVNESEHRLNPILDTDTLHMVKVLPVMLTDLNLAALFQSFSIIYAIDLDDENLKMAPNAFWRLRSDPTTDKKPEIGTIKPQVDYDQVLRLIESEISLWLGSKGIRASTVGSLSVENAVSGISKVIDEMDTFEARQKQVAVFKNAEADFWDLLLNHLHPYWSETGLIDNNARFTPSARIETTFATQLPTQSRGTVVRDVRDEYAAGFISKKRALKKINPEMTDEEIDALLVEIEAEGPREIVLDPRRRLPIVTEEIDG